MNKPKIVLCVDDEVEILNALKRELHSVANEVITASSAQQGLQWLQKLYPGVVIADMRMPEMNGAQFLQHVQNSHPSAFRILLTGYSDIDDAMAAVNQGGIQRYFLKPWDSHELTRAVVLGLENHERIWGGDSLVQDLAEKNKALRDLNETIRQLGTVQ